MIDNLIRFTHRVSLLGCGLAAALGVTSTNAATIFDNGALNTIDAVSDSIEVRDSTDPLPTTVDIVTGAVVGIAGEPSVTVLDTSSVNMTDGELADSFVAGGASISAISGGTIGNDIVAMDSATVNISGGTADDLILSDAATINLSGGSFDTVEATGGTFNFSGGRVDDIDTAAGVSQVNISGTALVDDDAFFFGNALVQVSGGQFDDEFQLFDNVGAIFTGGNIDDDLVVADNAVAAIDGLTVGDAIEASGSSQTFILGGTFGSLQSSESSTIRMLGGTVEESIVASLGGNVVVTGGQVAPEISASLNSSVELLGGTGDVVEASAGSGGVLNVNGFVANSLSVGVIAGEVNIDSITAGSVDVVAELEAEVLVSGGDADSLTVLAADDSIVTIKGGDFTSGDLDAQTGSTIFVFGSNFTALGLPLDAGPIPFVAGDLKGLLADGTPFDWTFRRNFGLNNAAQIVLVPEPTAFVTFVLASASLVNGRRRSGR